MAKVISDPYQFNKESKTRWSCNGGSRQLQNGWSGRVSLHIGCLTWEDRRRRQRASKCKGSKMGTCLAKSGNIRKADGARSEWPRESRGKQVWQVSRDQMWCALHVIESIQGLSSVLSSSRKVVSRRVTWSNFVSASPGRVCRMESREAMVEAERLGGNCCRGPGGRWYFGCDKAMNG